MTIDRESLRVRYDEIVPKLEDVCDDLLDWLEALTQSLGILDPRIEGRVKEPHSLILKAWRREIEGRPWDDPLVEATDKVGVRADVVYLADVPRLRSGIESAEDVVEVIDIDDKMETALGTDKLGYHGVHFDVIPVRLPDGLPREMALCEIQIRTNAQAAWAMATHDLTYKPPMDPGRRVLRRVNRLTALLECFDEDVGRTREEMMGRDGYAVAIVVGALEATRMRFPMTSFDRGLTRDVVTSLIDEEDSQEAHELARELETFAEENSAKLRELFSKVDYGHPMLGQPEALLIFMRLDSAPHALRQAWIENEFPYSILDDLAAEWGATLPTPN